MIFDSNRTNTTRPKNIDVGFYAFIRQINIIVVVIVVVIVIVGKQNRLILKC